MSDKTNPEGLKKGLCGNRGDHEPHTADSSTLGRFWCHADQSKREPHYSEHRRASLRRAARHGR